MMFLVLIERRSIADAVNGRPFRQDWRVYRSRWRARLVVWAVNTFGAGRDYDRARLLHGGIE